jgi:hypothetical protein
MEDLLFKTYVHQLRIIQSLFPPFKSQQHPTKSVHFEDGHSTVLQNVGEFNHHTVQKSKRSSPSAQEPLQQPANLHSTIL